MKRGGWTDEELDNIFDFIRKNRDKFDVEDPSKYHGTHFFNKLARRFKKAMVSIVPHLTKVFITTIFVWAFSFFIWGNWLSPNKDKKRYGSISFEHRMKEIKYNYYIITLRLSLRFNYLKDSPNIREDLKLDLREMDLYYEDLKKDLKTNPGNEDIINSMELYYSRKIKLLYDFISFYKQRDSIEEIVSVL